MSSTEIPQTGMNQKGQQINQDIDSNIVNENMKSKVLKQQKTQQLRDNKWQDICLENQKDEQVPLILKQESFKTQNQPQQYKRQKQMMQQAARIGKQHLVNKTYDVASKQLSKALMAFEFIAKNHAPMIGKQVLKDLVLTIVLPTYNNLALCYLKLKNYPLVLSFTNQVLGQDPDNIKARYRRAIANQHLKNTEQAIRDFQLIIKVDPQMQNDCNQKINQCRNIEKEEKIKRKLSAQRFLSGYQREDPKKQEWKQVNLNLKDNQNKDKIKEVKGNTVLQWVKDKCKNLSKILSKLKMNNKNNSKQE